MSSCGGIGSPCRCSWGIKRLGAAAHPAEGSGLWCAAACPDLNWLWWQWVAYRFWAECWSGVSPEQPRPVILPVSLKVSAVDQRGRKNGSQPLTVARGQVYHSDLWMRQKVSRWRRKELEGEVEKFGERVCCGSLIQTSPPPSMAWDSKKPFNSCRRWRMCF